MISNSCSRVQCIYVLLNKVALSALKCHQYKKKHLCCITRSIPLYFNIYPVIDKAPSRMSSTSQFLFIKTKLFTFKSIYLKYLKSLQSAPKFKFNISNDMWPHVFRYKGGLYFPIFLFTYLAYILFLLVCILKTVRCCNPL